MQWTHKARVQRWCAALPFSDTAYFLLQTLFGRIMEKPNPFCMLRACGELATDLRSVGRPVSGAAVFEVGSGRRLDMPLGMHLYGARQIITCDLHRLQRPDLVMAALRMFLADRERVIGELGAPDREPVLERLDRLASARNCGEATERAGIVYMAPADACSTGLAAGSVDVHLSYTVFEHIPPDVLRQILIEARRILSPGGVAIHHIDLSDHFSHDDPSILAINFLRYSDREWAALAGNRFAYHNRLRASEYAALYESAGHEILSWDVARSAASAEALRAGFPLDARFRNMDAADLCTTIVRVVSRRKMGSPYESGLARLSSLPA